MTFKEKITNLIYTKYNFQDNLCGDIKYIRVNK